MQQQSQVDAAWLKAEAAGLAHPCTPRRPMVVGGSGMVGSSLIVLLASIPDCEKIRVLDLAPPHPKVVVDASDKVEFVQCRLGCDPIEALVRALDGIDCVFCLVTPHIHKGTEEDFNLTNVVGVEQLVKACLDAAVPHFVYLSSIGVANTMANKVCWSESTPLPPMECYPSAYDVSKRKGEDIVLAANRAGQFSTCALRAGGIIQSTRDFIFESFFMLPGLALAPAGTKKIDFIDGRDVCRGLLLAAQALGEGRADVGGEVFYLTKGESHHSADLYKLAASILGWWYIEVPAVIIHLVSWLAWIVFCVKKLFGFRLAGFPFHLLIRAGYYEGTFDNTKISSVLGFHPKVPISEAVERVCTMYTNEQKTKRS